MPESLRVKIKKLHYQGIFNDSQTERLLKLLEIEKGKDINVATNDLISRQAVIDLYEKYHPHLATKVYEFGQELRKLPSVSGDDVVNQRAITCRHGGHCEWVACDKCNHYEPFPLSQQPYDDCISRQAVLDFIRSLQRWCVKSEDGKFNNVGLLYDDVMFGIDKLPSVTPKEKTGHWIRQTDDYHDYYECEHCGIAVGLDDIKNYCPNCGFRMFESQESEDKE